MRARQLFQTVLLTCVAVLAFPQVALPQGSADADSLEVSNYELSATGLANYTAASRALAPLVANNPPDCNDDGDESLSAMAARLDAVPGAPAALAGAGLGSREYIVFTLATFQAGMGAWALDEGQGELPPGVSPENVAFYQAHEAEFQQLSGLMSESGCEDNGDDDESEWEEGDDGGYDQ